MGKNGRKLFGVLIATLLLTAVGCDLHIGGDSTVANCLEASGVITAEEIVLSAQTAGRIAVVHVRAGESVEARQELVSLDTELIDAQVVLAQAHLAVAQAGLRQMEAGARPGAIAVAKAQLEQARAGHKAALLGLMDVEALRKNPQELDMQVAVGELLVEAEEHRLASAVAYQEAAQVGKDILDYTEAVIRDWPYPVPPPAVPTELRSVAYDWWRSWVGVNAGTVSMEAAKAELAHWRSVRQHPHHLDAQVESAKAAVAQAAAAVEMAQAQLAAYESGPSEEELSVMRSQVAQAQVALDVLMDSREETVVTAPIDSTVISQAAHAGEIAVPGGMLLSLADLSKLYMTVYVSENRLGQVALNERVLVSVDSFPERTFAGKIVRIADRAQFTPMNVSTKEERVNTVYAVKISLRNDEGLLKPGMPGDVVFVR